MSDDRRQQNFAERLSRIAQERGDEPRAPNDLPRRETSDFEYNAPRERHPIRNTLIWTILLAGLGTGGYFGWQALPPDLVALITGSDSENDDLALGPENILETDTMSSEGPTLASPVVAQAGGAPLDLEQIVTNVSLTNGATQITEITPIIRNARCDLRAPSSSEKVMGVRIENGGLTAPIHALSNAQLAQQLLANVHAVTQEGQNYASDGGLGGAKNSVDVILTDTTAPIYLVLQNMGSGVIWNLHAAPEVTVAHVAIIGADFSGVANLQSDTTFEAVLVSDFVPPHQYGADDAARDCMVRPWRNPQPDWIGVRKAAAGDLSFQNQMYSYTKGYEAYNRWYKNALGVDAALNTVSLRDAAHVLLGPVPDSPFDYNTMAGQAIYMMPTDHQFTGDQASREAAVAELQNRVLAAAIGGNVSALDPPAMERTGQ